MTIILRKTTADDLDFVLDAERHPDNALFVYQWSKIEHQCALDNKNICHFVVVNNDNLVGYVILDQVEDASASINLRRLVITDKKLGIATEVLKQIKQMAFVSLNAHRLWLDVFTDNLRAYNLYKKSGFREEGKLIESYLRNGQYVSQYIMAILQSEYK
jgi:ribosomal protein S18 acetylase RimI-like enzyme